MISVEIISAKAELLDAIWQETQNEQAVAIASRWLKKWIAELHVTHTLSRDILQHYAKDATGLIEHTHKAMYRQIAEEIFKRDIGVMETESNTDDKGRPHPFQREDHLTVYLFGKATLPTKEAADE